MSDTEKTDTAEVVGQQAAIGASLKAAREARGLSVEDVASHLRLSPRQIHALENDEFSALPETTITRGFIRNYARLLEIAAEPLLDAYKAYSPAGGPKAITIQSANILISGGDRRPWVAYISASIVIAVLLGAWLLYVEPARVGAPKAIAVAPAPTVSDPASNEVTEPLPVAALPAAERAQAAEPVPDAAAANNETAPAPAPEANVASAPMDPQDASRALAKVELRFTESSWVSVVDRNDREILNKTKPAGTAEQIEGQPPLKLIIGNAAGSVLVFNGKTVDLGPYTKLNVARITLE